MTRYLILLAAGLLASFSASAECVRKTIDGPSVEKQIQSVMKTHRPVSEPIDIGSGKQIKLKYDLSDRGNGTVKIKNLIILAYTPDKNDIHYQGSSLNFDFFPIGEASYCTLLVSGILETPHDRHAGPQASLIIHIYSYDPAKDMFIQTFERSGVNIDISGTTP